MNTETNGRGPDLPRRAFIVGSVAAAGGGLALGLRLPLGRNAGIGSAEAKSAATAEAEVNAWVVIKPDDTVVIRIARSEMGQGTRTGLAQLVAEELECDWRKVTTDSITPGQNLARKRVWGEMGTGGSRGIRSSQDYVRRGGAAARMMLLQAAANQWQVPVSEVTVADGVITHAASKRSTSYGKVAAAAAGLEAPDPKSIHAQGSERLEDCRQAAEAAGHGGQAERQPGLCDRRRAARHAPRRDQGMPGVRRHARELRRGEDRSDARGTPRRQGQRHDGCGRRRYLVEGQAGARRAADRLGGGRRRLAVERDDRGAPQGGPDGGGHQRVTSERRRPQGDRRAPHERSRRSTARRSSPTRPWSR